MKKKSPLRQVIESAFNDCGGLDARKQVDEFFEEHPKAAKKKIRLRMAEILEAGIVEKLESAYILAVISLGLK